MEMVNGYVFLDLTKSNVYAKALKVLGADKPVIIKEGSGAPYFVDSLTLDGTNVVITKGGKTITIANDNTITNVGDIQNHLYEYSISDNDGKIIARFLSPININIEFDDLENIEDDEYANQRKDMYNLFKNYLGNNSIKSLLLSNIDTTDEDTKIYNVYAELQIVNANKIILSFGLNGGDTASLEINADYSAVAQMGYFQNFEKTQLI